MKKIPTNLLGKFLAISVAATSICALGVNYYKTLESSDNKTLNYVEKDAVSSQKTKELAEVLNENEVAQTTVTTSNEAKVENAVKEVEKATLNQKAAEEEVTKADTLLKNAEKVKEEALAEVEAAKTPEAKKAAQAKVETADAEVQKATQTQKEAVAKKQAADAAVKEAQEVVEQVKQEEETVNNQVNETSKNQTKNRVKKAEQPSKTTTNDEVGGAAKQRELSSADWDKINEALKAEQERLAKEGNQKEPEEHNVEFHFYTTLRDLKVRRNGDASYWAECGVNGVNCIWFVEFSCDMNECEGFAEPGSDKLSGKVLIGRRGDTMEYVMQPPKAKPGYRFKAWEIVSAKGTVTKYGETGVLVSKYRAVYEKY